jgi:DNA-binding NarL/FixJ family response regulator
MPGGGLEGLRRLREKVPEAKILVLTALDTPGLGEEVLRAGAQGLVEKTADPEEILRAIHAILRGETLVPLEENLTAREEEILRTFGARPAVGGNRRKIGDLPKDGGIPPGAPERKASL